MFRNIFCMGLCVNWSRDRYSGKSVLLISHLKTEENFMGKCQNGCVVNRVIAATLQGQAHKGLCPSDQRHFHMEWADNHKTLVKYLNPWLVYGCHNCPYSYLLNIKYITRTLAPDSSSPATLPKIVFYRAQVLPALPHLLQSSSMAVGIHKCCTKAIHWTIPCPHLFWHCMACAIRRKMEMVLN